MPEKYKADIPSREATPQGVFFSRRKFMTAMTKGILLSPATLWAMGSAKSEAAMLDVPFHRPDVFPVKQSQKHTLPEGINSDLTMVVTGVYGQPLIKQHGAPIRIIVPWKYGYKSPKSIVKIEFVARQPKIFWQIQAHEYGFLSNVNPNIPHPRWSQEWSVWLHSSEKFPTPILNGYDK